MRPPAFQAAAPPARARLAPAQYRLATGRTTAAPRKLRRSGRRQPTEWEQGGGHWRWMRQAGSLRWSPCNLKQRMVCAGWCATARAWAQLRARPSSPPSHQHTPVPLRSTPHVCSKLALMLPNSSPPSVGTGVLLCPMPATPSWPHSFDLQAEAQRRGALTKAATWWRGCPNLKGGARKSPEWTGESQPLRAMQPGAHPKQYARPESTRPHAKSPPMLSCSDQLSAPATFSGVALVSKSMPVPSWPFAFDPQHHQECSSKPHVTCPPAASTAKRCPPGTTTGLVSLTSAVSVGLPSCPSVFDLHARSRCRAAVGGIHAKQPACQGKCICEQRNP